MRQYYVRFLAGSDNVARYGSPEGPFEDPEAALAHGRHVAASGPVPEGPGEAGVRGFLVEDQDGAVVWEE